MERLNPFNTKAFKVLKKIVPPGSSAFEIIVSHGLLVAAKALKGANRVSHLNPDRVFILDACLIHDVGAYFTNAPEIGCTGEAPVPAECRHSRVQTGSVGAPGGQLPRATRPTLTWRTQTPNNRDAMDLPSNRTL